MLRNNTTEKQILEVANELTAVVPETAQTDVAELARAREWGIAVEVLCEMLHEDSLRISHALFQRIKRLGRSMDLDDSYWEHLTPRVEPE